MLRNFLVHYTFVYHIFSYILILIKLQMIDHCPITSAHNQYTTFTHSIHTTNILLSHSQSIYHYYTLFTVNTHYKYTTFTHSITQPISYTCILLQNKPWRVSTREREKAQSKVVTLLKTLYINTFTYNYVQAYSYSAKRTRMIIRKKRQFLCT